MPGSRPARAIASAVAAFCVLGPPTTARGQDAATRITTEAALEHVVTRVEAFLPAVAVLTKQGGNPVKADITIGIDGTVEDVAVIEGWRPLHNAAIDALKQWTFKPFLQNGRAARVVATVEVTFRGHTDDEKRSVESFTKAHFQCRRQLEAAPRDARTPVDCAEAVRLSALMPADERWKRSEALLSYGQSLFVAGQHAEALGQLDAGLAMAVRAFGPEDADVASVHLMVAILHFAAKDYARADELFATAVKTFEAALKRLPGYAGNYIPRLQTALKHYAQAKALMNDAAGARALMERAAALAPPPAAPSDDPAVERVVAEARVIGPRAARVTEADVREIQALAGPSAKLWVIETGRPSDRKGTVSWMAKVYLVPDSASDGLRRGRTFHVETTLRAPEQFDGRTPWKTFTRLQNYVQVPVAGRDPSALTTSRDLNRPIFVFGERDAFTDEELLGLVIFLRASGATSRPAMVRSEIQPWPIEHVMRLQGGQVMVQLLDQDPASSRGQSVRLERSGGSWTVVQILVTGGP